MRVRHHPPAPDRDFAHRGKVWFLHVFLGWFPLSAAKIDDYGDCDDDYGTSHYDDDPYPKLYASMCEKGSHGGGASSADLSLVPYGFANMGGGR